MQYWQTYSFIGQPSRCAILRHDILYLFTTTVLSTNCADCLYKARMSSSKDIKNTNAHAFEDDSSQLSQDAPPPPYEVHSSGPVLSSSFGINDQGTVDVSFSGASPELVNDYLPPIHHLQDSAITDTTDSTCPPLNIAIHVVGSRGRFYMLHGPLHATINFLYQATCSHSLLLVLP